MKEQILEMIAMSCEHFVPIPFKCKNRLAEEITAHVFEFIEWTHHGSHPFVAWQDIENAKLIKYFTDEINPKKYSLEEIYQYWLTNIKNVTK